MVHFESLFCLLPEKELNETEVETKRDQPLEKNRKRKKEQNVVQIPIQGKRGS